MNEEKIRLRFEYTNEFGDNFVSESTCLKFEDEPDLYMFGEFFNTFLQQCGYIRNNSMIFMEDITEDEYDALAQYLDELRNPAERK